jgi:hypothetical protein
MNKPRNKDTKAGQLKQQAKKFQMLAARSMFDVETRKIVNEIAAAGAPRSAQIELLGRAIFNEDWDD